MDKTVGSCNNNFGAGRQLFQVLRECAACERFETCSVNHCGLWYCLRPDCTRYCIICSHCLVRSFTLFHAYSCTLHCGLCDEDRFFSGGNNENYFVCSSDACRNFVCGKCSEAYSRQTNGGVSCPFCRTDGEYAAGNTLPILNKVDSIMNATGIVVDINAFMGRELVHESEIAANRQDYNMRAQNADNFEQAVAHQDQLDVELNAQMDEFYAAQDVSDSESDEDSDFVPVRGGRGRGGRGRGRGGRGRGRGRGGL